jgi:pyruvate kinase
MKAGLDVARLNMAHGTIEEHQTEIKNLREVASEIGHTLGILIDLAGPKLRIGEIEGGQIELKNGELLTITSRQVIGRKAAISINYPDVLRDLKVGDQILIDEGQIILKVVETRGRDILVKVVEGGVLHAKRGINLPGVTLHISALTDRDREVLDFALQEKVDWIALSFVKSAQDILALKRIIAERGSKAKVIAKIEKPEAVADIEAILEVSDGVMIARGDLGVEMPAEEVPVVQKQIIRKAQRRAKPVITATQMLDSMIHRPSPTRAEVSDVANAILDGTDAVMLSGETAIGKYPVKAVEVMSKVILETEKYLAYGLKFEQAGSKSYTPTEAISSAVCEMAHDLGAKVIITATQSGATARQVAKHRPKPPIVAVSPESSVVAQLRLVWGVIPLKVESSVNIDDMFQKAVTAAVKRGLIKVRDVVIITAGVLVNVPGTTNLIKVHQVTKSDIIG